jgi:hypothetical protein
MMKCLFLICAPVLIMVSAASGQTNAPMTVTSLAPQIISNQWQVALPPATNAGSVYYRLMK